MENLKTPRKKAAVKKNTFLDHKYLYLGLGALFGYFLSKARATDYDTVTDMFLLRDLRVEKGPNGSWFHPDGWHMGSLHLYGVILMAVAVIVLGLHFLPKKVPALSPAKYVFTTAIYIGLIWLLFHFWPQTGAFVLAISLVAIVCYLLPPSRTGKVLVWKSLKWNPKRLPGAFLFGIGWALAGACPATAMAQIGEGKVSALFILLGIVTGIWLYQKYKPLPDSKDDQVC